MARWNPSLQRASPAIGQACYSGRVLPRRVGRYLAEWGYSPHPGPEFGVNFLSKRVPTSIEREGETLQAYGFASLCAVPHAADNELYKTTERFSPGCKLMALTTSFHLEAGFREMLEPLPPPDSSSRNLTIRPIPRTP